MKKRIIIYALLALLVLLIMPLVKAVVAEKGTTDCMLQYIRTYEAEGYGIGHIYQFKEGLHIEHEKGLQLQDTPIGVAIGCNVYIKGRMFESVTNTIYCHEAYYLINK